MPHEHSDLVDVKPTSMTLCAAIQTRAAPRSRCSWRWPTSTAPCSAKLANRRQHIACVPLLAPLIERAESLLQRNVLERARGFATQQMQPCLDFAAAHDVASLDEALACGMITAHEATRRRASLPPCKVPLWTTSATARACAKTSSSQDDHHQIR